MTRIKRGVTKRRRHKKMLQLTKGHRGVRHRLYRRAHESFIHAQQYAYAHRKEKKGDMRQAIELYSTALKRNSTLTEAHYRIAQLYLGQGRSVLAEIHLDRFRALKAAAAEAL